MAHLCPGLAKWGIHVHDPFRELSSIGRGIANDCLTW